MNLLIVKSSPRGEESISSMIVDKIVEKLSSHCDNGFVTRSEDLSSVPFVSPEQTMGNFTSESEVLISNMEWADVIVIGTPIYNFGVPGVLKAWFDQVAQAGRTFNYTENGPIGFLNNKKVYLGVASGGVPVGSPVDFATPWIKTAMSLIGINDVKVISADQVNLDYDKSMSNMEEQLKKIFS